MSQLEDFDDIPVSVEETPLPVQKPAWSKAMAWAVLGVGAIYLLNPLAGIDVIPDFIPIVGNLDEAAVVLAILGAMRYLNIPLPEFIESWIQPARQLPASTDEDPE